MAPASPCSFSRASNRWRRKRCDSLSCTRAASTKRSCTDCLLGKYWLPGEEHQGAPDPRDQFVLLLADPASSLLPAVSSPDAEERAPGGASMPPHGIMPALGGRCWTRSGLSLHRSGASQDMGKAEGAREAGPSASGRRAKGRGWRFWAKAKPMKQRIREGTCGGIKGRHRRRIVIIGAPRPSQPPANGTKAGVTGHAFTVAAIQM